jgi:hypothetical protein
VGKRVMALLLKLYGRLRLKVYQSKSAVASVFQRKLLGFSFWVAAGGQSVDSVYSNSENAIESGSSGMAKAIP